MKTPQFFSKQQYRKWQVGKRMKKKSALVITAGIVLTGIIAVIIWFY